MKLRKLLFGIILLIPVFCFSLEYPKTNSKIVEIYDLVDNKILYEVNSNEVVSVASLTKIVTTIVAIENIKDFDEKVFITWNMLSKVSDNAHVAGLKVGDKVTYKDLLYATMVTSGADAANSLAISVSGSISNHVKKMNELCDKMGLIHTHFNNVVGLDDKNNYSTADEMRKILLYALNNNLFKKIFQTKKYQLLNGLVIYTTLKIYDNNAKIDTSSIIGSKTGFTSKAGYCLSSISDINNHEMLIITLHAEKKGNNYYNLIDTNNLIKFMRLNYQNVTLVKKSDLIKEIPVNLSDIDVYQIYANSDVQKYLPSDYDINNLKIVYEGINKLSYRNKKGEKIGTVSYFFDDELLLQEDVVLNQKIRLNFIKVLKEYYWWILTFIIIFFSITYLIRKRKVHG